jgi:hypothetical protein
MSKKLLINTKILFFVYLFKNLHSEVLRGWFSAEMGKLGVPDRFIDLFQFRATGSVKNITLEKV